MYSRGAVCAHRCALFLLEKQTRIPFLMRTGAKVFYNVGEDAYIRFCYKTDFNVSRHPFCKNHTCRVRYATLIADVDVLVLQIVHGPAYLSSVLDSRQLFVRKLCGNENRDDGYSARRFIPTR